MIGLDGMSANSIKNEVEMPTYRSMMKRGVYTLKTRSVLPSSSAANWASIFMGASPEQHGFNTWGSQKPDFEIPESTMVYDIGSTIGYMFGVNQPQVWIGRPIKSIFSE